MESVYESGKTKGIGVSNYGKKHLVTLMEDTKIVPMYNQIELNPYI